VSGTVQPAVLGPAQIANLLERVVHDRVLDAVDLLGVYRLEISIAAMIGELDGIAEAHAAELAAAMIDRAVQRLPDDLRRLRRDDDWLPDPAGSCFLCRGGERAPAAEAGTDRPRGRPKR
jgi:hypothetical protein